MEKDLTHEWHKPGTSATSPHFDEEWTVLTAKPVVPLSKLKSNASRRRVLKLSAAFVLSILLGALVALVAANLNQPSENATIEAVTEQQNIAESAPTPGEMWETWEATEEQPAAVLPKKIPIIVTVKPKTSATQDRQTASSANLDRLTENSSASVEEQETPPIVLNRFEERRLRRVFRRERRERAAQRNRDLRRIDEIFEGRRP
jgi:hypothetical protein